MNKHIKDRGTKKWTSLMFPEHVEQLKQVFAEEKREAKPILDEQYKMDINRKLQDAFVLHDEVEITYYAHFKRKKTVGKLLSVGQGYIRLNNDERTKITFDNILDVEICL